MDVAVIALSAPVMPNPLPTDWQALMDLMYTPWQALSRQVAEHNKSLDERCCDLYVNPAIAGMLRAPTRQEMMAVMPAKVNAAVTLSAYNYQVGNGGHAQHVDNRYADGVPALVAMFGAAAILGIDQAAEASAIINEYAKRLDDLEKHSSPMGCFSDDDDDGDMGDPYGDLDTRWYALDTEVFCQAVLDRFEEINAISFNSHFRMAA